MKKFGTKCYVIGLVAVLAFGGLSLAFGKPGEFSQNENRYLQKRPEITVEGILSAQVQQEMERYACDQLLGRDVWMAAATNVKRLINRNEINGVYLGKDGHLFQRLSDDQVSYDNYEKNIQLLRDFGDNHGIAVSFLLVPDASIVLGDDLPKGALVFDADAYYASGEVTDLREPLQEALSSGMDPYFWTDHHWNTDGAYIGAKVYLSSRQETVLPQDAYGLTRVSDDFYGTTYSKVAGLCGVRADELRLPTELPKHLTVQTRGRADSVALSENSGTDSAIWSDSLQALQKAGIYDLSKLTGKDQYAVYFGGNYGWLEISNPDPKAAGKHLLILKDSFANSMVVYLLPYYETITMVDLRYFNGSFAQVTEACDPTELLVLYELTNFADEKNLYKILE